jgi:rod shape-determining protein MreD
MSSLAPVRIGEPASPFQFHGVPVASVMLASALPLMLPMVASSAVLPPLGLLMFLAWRLLHPTLWPVWVGLPLGLWDDLLSGQPIGSAMGLWTIAMLTIDFVDQRTYWRGYWQDWLIAGIAIVAIQLLAAMLAHPGIGPAKLAILIGFPTLVAIMMFPVMVRLAARLDSIRLLRR